MWTKHKKLLLAILGSLLIHVLILFVAAAILGRQPENPLTARPPKPLRLQIVEQEKKKVLVPVVQASPTPPVRRRTINASDLAEASSPPPADTAFESDKNTIAQSELAPTGTEAGPSQEGRAIPEFMFDTHKSTAQSAPSASAKADNSPPQPVATPVPETAPPLPRPDIQAAPTPGPAAIAIASTPSPTPPPASTPDEFAALQPRSTPKPVDFDPFTRARRPSRPNRRRCPLPPPLRLMPGAMRSRRSSRAT